VYAAAEEFIRQGLQTDGSLFTPGRAIWTAASASDLHERFVQRPDDSDDKFDLKFQRQLAGAPANTIQLAAELLYVHFLISLPTQIGGDRKRELIRMVLSWSASPVALPSQLAVALDSGLCNAGRSFLQHRPFLLAYLIDFLLAWKKLDAGRRDALLKDPWQFKQFVFAVPAPSARIQQHALLHLVFPNVFESIVSETHKQTIVEAFRGPDTNVSDDVDRQILTIRNRLAGTHGPDFTFYDAALRPQWRPPDEDVAPPPVAPTEEARGIRWWVEKTLVAGRPDRNDGDWVFGRVLWSPQRSRDGRDYYRTMREVKVGDIVLHFVDNRKFSGVSRVAKGPDTTSTPPLGTAWSEGPIIRYDLEDFVPLNPAIEREDLFQDPETRARMQEIVAGHRGLFFNKDLDLNQGAYLTAAPAVLVNLLNDIYVKKAQSPLPHLQLSSILPEVTPPPADQRALTLDWLADQTLWPQERLLEVIQALQSKSPQVVLAGPPGTGKTWIAQLLARYVTQDRAGGHRVVQFHPSYSYEAFMEGLRPVSEGGQIHFRPVPGVVLELARALGSRQEPYVLIVDEMNRANLPKVLGELMYLLEYRDTAVDLQYTKGFRLPPNLWFLGTMNTADRSIRSIDIALRRRFDIFECPPDAEALTRYFTTRENRVPSLVAGFMQLNEELTAQLDRHHTIGHTFFMANPMTEEALLRVWRRKIGPLIEEYFFDQPDVARSFEPSRFWPELSE
jgi:5-methylcytosine-specific restriction protein B